MSAVALAAAALAVPAVLSDPVGSKTTISAFGAPEVRDGVEGFALYPNFNAAEYDPFEALMVSFGRPTKIAQAIEAAGIAPTNIIFEVLGASDPADLSAYLEERDEDAAPEAVWVAAWGEDNVDNGDGLQTENLVFVRVL